MKLEEALTQISEIRAQITRTETFRGYRSATVGLTGLLAFTAAGLQSVWIADPRGSMGAYLTLWTGTAGLCLVATACELIVRCYRAASPWTARLTWMAVEQFLPCVFAGGVLTFTMTQFARESLWLLPGLWSILYSLGVFASCRLLPRPIFWVGAFYLIAGVLCLALARGEAAFSPWAMAVPFGIGQFLTAGILHFTLERSDG